MHHIKTQPVFVCQHPHLLLLILVSLLSIVAGKPTSAQSVCIPSPRLLTIFPMGAQIGTSVEVSITGENLDELEGLFFSDPRISAGPVLDDQQRPVPNRFRITIPADLQPGLVEAFARARLGVSSGRFFSLGKLPESVIAAASPTLKEAQPIAIGSTINATMLARGANHYQFQGQAGQNIRIDCCGRGIDSKLDPVVSLSDEAGRVLATDRLGNGLYWQLPGSGAYIIKVHDLTYQGGPEFFYRLSLQTESAEQPAFRFASTRQVAQYSWPPAGYDTGASRNEAEPNDTAHAQPIELPCQIRGSFFPAADVDCFEFRAIKGQSWWIEIASHRLGIPTGPAANVQRAISEGEKTVWQDVLELKDIAPPMKASSNHYAYDGPPYNGGSTDLIGKLDIPEDGLYRLQMNDLFGGTRNDPGCVYELVIRNATPDFALTGWVKHIELRNGDRNALSKPLALRAGATVALEIGAFRRDGFNEPIQLQVSGLPDGVSAATIDIPAGQTAGTVLLTADARAPKSMQNIRIVGQSQLSGNLVTVACQIASMAWPIRDHWQEFPRPRLSTTIPLSVTDAEPHTITIQGPLDATGRTLIQAKANSTVTIPLQIERRCEFSGAVLSLNTLGQGFQANPRFDIALQSEQAEVNIDLAKLKIAPGTYTLAFYGSAVAKYRDYVSNTISAENDKRLAAERTEQLKLQLQALVNAASAAEPNLAAQTAAQRTSLEQELQNAEAALTAADNVLKQATARSQPTDVADIVVTRPFTLEVAEEK
jgi:hypothetical protein